MKGNPVYTITISAVLCAMGILIPMISPFKIIIEPASFTFASHVAIIIAMFISPSVASFVSVITTLGFLLGGFPITVVCRALSHLGFALIGAIIIRKNPKLFNHWGAAILFIIGISILHAILEVIIVLPFYMTSSFNEILYPLFGLVGIGTFIHSCVDFIFAIMIFKVLLKSNQIKKIATVQSI